MQTGKYARVLAFHLQASHLRGRISVSHVQVTNVTLTLVDLRVSCGAHLHPVQGLAGSCGCALLNPALGCSRQLGLHRDTLRRIPMRTLLSWRHAGLGKDLSLALESHPQCKLF